MPSNGISFCKVYALGIILGNRPVEFRLRNITYTWGPPPYSSGILITSFWLPLSTSPRESKISSVQSLSSVRLFATPWTAARQASLSVTNPSSLTKCMPIESVMPSNHLILCRPLLFLPSICPNIRVFSNELALCIKWPKYQKSKNIELPYDPAVPLLGIYLEKIKTQKDTCTPEFVSTLFTIPRHGRKLSVHQQRNG